ncbi:hypothetical protein EW146_g9399 [Bondarzewia mesenterica]|uniref:Uncharacterized protein n=1 Tax=Bondarzewia mesenterica TaxID=1095465 RepID=A0A4S4L745_9AGAM|nr:hypothetical protein EW146_g9399 [Bondarzewia mesenterica]
MYSELEKENIMLRTENVTLRSTMSDIIFALPQLLRASNPLATTPPTSKDPSILTVQHTKLPALKKDDHPQIQYWHKHSYQGKRKSAVTDSNASPGRKGKSKAAQGINVSMRYVEDSTGEIIDGYQANAICEYASAIWRELLASGVAPPTWGSGPLDATVKPDMATNSLADITVTDSHSMAAPTLTILTSAKREHDSADDSAVKKWKLRVEDTISESSLPSSSAADLVQHRDDVDTPLVSPCSLPDPAATVSAERSESNTESSAQCPTTDAHSSTGTLTPVTSPLFSTLPVTNAEAVATTSTQVEVIRDTNSASSTILPVPSSANMTAASLAPALSAGEMSNASVPVASESESMDSTSTSIETRKATALTTSEETSTSAANMASNTVQATSSSSKPRQVTGGGKAGRSKFVPNAAITARNIFGEEWLKDNPEGTKDEFAARWSAMSKSDQAPYDLRAKNMKAGAAAQSQKA